MRSVNTSTRNAWNTISYTNIRIYLPESETNISDEYISSISMDEAISDTDNMFFVGCVSTKVQITLNNFSTNLHLKPIEIYCQKGTTTELKVYTGKIYTCDIDEKNNTCKIIAYDSMYRIFNANVTDWYNSLSFPMTLKAFRNAFFTRFNVTQNSANLLFDSMTVERTIGGDEILGRDVIKPLCEANCCFGHIDHDGKMKYISLTNNNRTVPVGEISTMWNAKYSTDVISQVVVRENEEDVGAISGTGSNTYIIQGNMFFLGKSQDQLQTIADTIFTTINTVSFTPTESTQQYNAVYELGDMITVPDSLGNTYQSIILQRSTDFQRETTKAKGLKDYSQAASYTNLSLVSLLGKSNRLYRDIEQTRSTIANVEEGLQTEITQTANGLQVQIDEIHEELNGEIFYYTRDGVPTLNNYPYWDFTTAIPCNNTIQLSETYTAEMLDGGDQFPHFFYSEADKKAHRNNICINNLTNISYKFAIEGGNWFWKEITDSEYTLIMARVSALEVTAEQLSSDYTELSLDLRDNYWGITDTQSAISQSASAITASVSQTYQTISGMSDYQTVNGMNSYYTKSETYKKAEIDATIDGLSQVYETQSHLEANYYPKNELYTKSDLYTKSQLYTKSDLYTKSQVYSKSEVYTKSDVYTKGEINSTIEGLSLVYETQSDLEANYYPKNQLYTKSQLYTQSQLYTKSQINATINGLSSVYETQADLQANYYDKSQLYTKTQLYTKSEVDQTIDGLSLTYETKTDLQSNYYTRTQSNNRYYDKTTSDNRYYASADASLLIGRVDAAESDIGGLESDITGLNTAITAKVSKSSPSGQTSFSWQITDTKMEWKANSQSIMRLNSSGLKLTGEVNATSGTIGGWNLANGNLKSTNNQVVIQGSDGTIYCQINGDNKWVLNGDGNLFAKSADIKGNITADSGKIGNWNVSNGAITNSCIKIQGDGNIVCYSSPTSSDYKWVLYNNGNAHFKNATIDGYATANTVSALRGEFDTLNAKAITTDNFSAQNINANKITAGTLSANRIDINGIVLSLGGKALSCYSLSANYGYFQTGLYLFDNNVQYGFYRRSATIAGQTIHFWGW